MGLEQNSFLPWRRLTLRDCLRLPSEWGKTVYCSYARVKKRAENEVPPGRYTLLTGVFQALAAKDRTFIDKAEEVVGSNVSEDAALNLTGAALCALGYNQQGVTRLRKAVHLNPSHDNLIALGDYLESPMDYYEKLKNAHRILGENPRDVDALRHTASVLLQYDRLSEAQEYAMRALQISPKASGPREVLGEILFRRGKHTDALAEYKRSCRWFERSAYVWQQLAYCYYFTGNLGKAERAAIKMKKLGSREPPVSSDDAGRNSILDEIKGTRKLGVEYCKPDLKDWALPLLRAEASRERQPGEAALYLAALETVSTKDASCIESAVARIGDNVPKPDVLTVSGLAKFEAGHETVGLAELRQAVELNPSVQNLYNLAICLCSLSDCSVEAEILFRKVLLKEPEHASSLWELASLVGDTDEALELYAGVSGSEAGCWRAHFEMGECLRRMECPRQGIAKYQKARELADGNPALISIGIARCWLSLGDNDKALDNAERAFVENPKLAEAQELFAELRE